MTRSRSASSWPTPTDLENAPALATLATLHDTLDLLGTVLCAAHPELLATDADDDDAMRSLGPGALAANRLLVLAENALDAIRAYRDVVTLPQGPSGEDDDDIPF